MNTTDSRARVRAIFCLTDAFVLMVLLAWLLRIILTIELRERGRHVSSLFTIPNVLLFNLITNGAATSAAAAWYHLDGEPRLANVIRTFFFSASQITYLFYSWVRSHDVLRCQSSPTAFRIFRWILYTTPLVCMTPFITSLIPADDTTSLLLEMVSSVASGLVVIVLDSFFAYSFISQIRQVNEASIQSPPQYKIIARYGLFASAACLCILFLYIGSSVTSLFTDSSSRGMYTLLNGLTFAAYSVVAWALVKMKLELLTVHSTPTTQCPKSEGTTVKKSVQAFLGTV